MLTICCVYDTIISYTHELPSFSQLERTFVRNEPVSVSRYLCVHITGCDTTVIIIHIQVLIGSSEHEYHHSVVDVSHNIWLASNWKGAGPREIQMTTASNLHYTCRQPTIHSPETRNTYVSNINFILHDIYHCIVIPHINEFLELIDAISDN